MYYNFVDPRDLRGFPLAERFEKALLAVCAVDRELSVGTLASFVSISRRIPAISAKALTLREIADELGMGYSSLLRQTDCLASGSNSVRSLGLIEKLTRSDDRRSRTISLTQDGLTLMQNISDCMNAPLTPPRLTISAPGED